MDSHELKILYESPEVEIYKTRVQSVICGSQGQDLEPWTRDTEESW